MLIMKEKILFICLRNSARSVMAEGLANHFFGDRFEAESAGIEAGELSPFAVEAMKEIGIDISGKSPRQAIEIVKTGRVFGHAITLCDEAAEGHCPVLPRSLHLLHWPFPNPSSTEGSVGEKMESMRNVRDSIRRKIEEWSAGFADGA